MKLLNVAILGCGAIAERRHAPACSKMPNVHLYAFYDVTEERARHLAEKYNAKAFTDLELLLKEKELDAVCICAPERFHCEIALKAFAAGKHVLCEKPMALSLEDAKKMQEASQKAGKILMIAFSQRLYQEHILVKKLLKEHVIGNPTVFKTSLAHAGAEYASAGAVSEFYDKNLKNIGGVMSSVGCHRIDLIRYLFDSPIQYVDAFTPTVDKKYSNGTPIDAEDTAMIQAKLKNGIVGTFYISWCDYGEGSLETIIYGTKGTIICNGKDMVKVVQGNTVQEYQIHKDQEELLGYDIVKNFLQACLGETTPIADGMDGLACMQVLEAINNADQKSNWIEVEDSLKKD